VTPLGAVDAIDVDDQATWPDELLEQVDAWLAALEPGQEYPGDLDLPQDEWAPELLAGRPLRAYHATRLLPHEVLRVLAEGLLPLTRDLVESRIAGAHAAGYIEDEDAALFRRTNVFRHDGGRGRRDQVCLILGDTPLRQSRGVGELLRTWGGEAQYAASLEPRDRLKLLGRPTIVVARVHLSVPGEHRTYPHVQKVLCGARLGLSDSWADVMYRSPVPPQQIVGVWQPGDPGYDRFARLPRQ
jgi:hypothetical protein